MTEKADSARTFDKHCLDCGEAFTARRLEAKFCSDQCRATFTRRRRDRGAELYDFVMGGDTVTVAKLIHAYRTADAARRSGRKSYIPVNEAVRAIPIVYGKEGDKR